MKRTSLDACRQLRQRKLTLLEKNRRPSQLRSVPPPSCRHGPTTRDGVLITQRHGYKWDASQCYPYTTSSSLPIKDEENSADLDRSLLFSALPVAEGQELNAPPKKTAVNTKRREDTTNSLADFHSRGVGPEPENPILFSSIAEIDADEEYSLTDEDEDLHLANDRKPMFVDKQGAPMGHLKNHYLAEFGIKIEPNHFESSMSVLADDKTEHVKTAWTSIFICPVTKRRYPSGRLMNQLHKYLRDEDLGTNKDINATAVWYGKKTGAENAAAARALDDIQIRTVRISEPRFCEEEPFNPGLDYDEDGGSTERKHGNPDMRRGDHRSNKLLNMKRTLSITYQNVHGVQLTSENYVNDTCTSTTEHGMTSEIWSSCFVCPVSGTRYLSDNLPAAIVSGGESEGVFFETKEAAENAASFLALEAHQHSLCDSEILDTGEDSAFSAASMKNGSSASVVFDENERKENSDDHSSTSSSENTVPVEEEYIVSDIPIALGTPPSFHLLKVAADINGQNVVSEPDISRSNATDVSTHIGYGLENAVENAEIWLKSFEKSRNDNPHRIFLPHNDQNLTLLRGKALLAGLAHALNTCPIGIDCGSEQHATKILNVLWTSSVPDTETYTQFIKCIDHQDPRVAASTAEKIVQDMVDGTKYRRSEISMPNPDQDTINALIQAQAQIGGTTGRISNHTYNSFEPNRVSFLSVLSSSIYRPSVASETGGFDPKFAKECIERMEQIFRKTGDVSMQPDTQVYNAPLRWTGGPALWIKSRPYARYIQWENYGNMYSKGMRSDVDKSDPRMVEANAIDEWLHTMENDSKSQGVISPDIETYEAVIHGWLRTATRQGLERSVSILDRILQRSPGVPSSVQLRLQTFHPVLAAWHHSQCEDSAEMILHIIHMLDQCDYLDGRDSRLLELHMSTCLSRQSELVARSGIGSEKNARPRSSTKLERDEKCKQEVCRAAEEITAVLKEYLHHDAAISSNEIVSFVPFICAMRAWNNVALAAADDAAKLSQVRMEMMNVFSLFQDSVKTWTVPDIVHDTTPPQSVDRHVHYLAGANHFFATVVSLLSALDKGQSLESSIVLIEQMVRLAAEVDEIVHHHSGRRIEASAFRARKACPRHEDGFSYKIKEESYSSLSRYAFLWHVVTYLERNSLHLVNTGDIVRLCLLICDLSSLRNSSSRMKESVDLILDQILPGAPHRKRNRSRHSQPVHRDLSEIWLMDAAEMNFAESEWTKPNSTKVPLVRNNASQRRHYPRINQRDPT